MDLAPRLGVGWVFCGVWALGGASVAEGFSPTPLCFVSPCSGLAWAKQQFMKYLLLLPLLFFSIFSQGQTVKNYEGQQIKATMYSLDDKTNGFTIGKQDAPFQLMLATVAKQLIITHEEADYWTVIEYNKLTNDNGVLKAEGTLKFLKSGKVACQSTFEIHPTRIVIVDRGTDGTDIETIYYRASGFDWGTLKNRK